MSGHPVWFERPIVAELDADVHARCTVLGPGTPSDPYLGLAEARGVVASINDYGEEFFDRAPQVKVLARTGIGYDKVDLDAATRRGVVVCNAPDGPTVSTAEHDVALMLAAAKRLKQAEAMLRRGGTDFYATHRSLELRGKRLALIGCGRIPRRVAVVAQALGMSVTAHDPYLADDEFPDGVEPAETLEAALEGAQVVSVHVPLSDSTRGMFNTATFEKMEPGVVFVNSARGGLVHLDALAEALDSGRVGAAGLDVTEPEPLPPDHPLLHREDVVVTPHVAAATAEARRGNFLGAFEQVLQVLDGVRPPHIVNPAAWPEDPS